MSIKHLSIVETFAATIQFNVEYNERIVEI